MATDSNGLNSRDANQVIRAQAKELADGTVAQRSIDVANLIPDPYDHLTLTYVAAGNGAGEVETVTYRSGGAGGTVVATLTLTYDASNRVITVARS